MVEVEGTVNKSIFTTFLLALITALSNNLLGADLSGNDATQALSYQGKPTYSLLLHEDLIAFEQPAAPAAPERKEQPQERGTTESLFSLDFPKLLLRDTWYVLTSPVHWDAHDWLTFSVATLGVGAVAFLDHPIQTQVQRNQNSSTNNLADDIRCFGGACSFGVLGLFYAGGAYFHDDVAKAVAIDGGAASLVASGIIAPTLKWAVGRARPDAGLGNHYFTPFSGSNESFPSGETTQAFAVASVIAAHYDELWVKVSSYGIASLVGMARIYENGHWTSDALAGALIGTAVGTAIVHFNEKRRKDKKEEMGFLITPLLARGTAGIAITLVR
ncbi:MAG TPA: phosphatase PAP2 family protein [Syntrophorhabdales bacterium]|nr:phosphatase PAP2 family protein [Syntrophorhabdales bacterium]